MLSSPGIVKHKPIMKIIVLPMSTEPILLRPANGDRPQYLLERSDGNVVPLVPADELPEDVKLTVKRTMTMDEAFALGIQVVTFQRRQSKTPKLPAQQPAAQTLEHPKARIANSGTQATDIPPVAAANTTLSDASSRTTPQWGSARPTTSSKQQYRQAGDPLKRYCSYWIHHGECDFEQEGCKFLHEMPDRKTLRAIGFRKVPRWWIEKQSMKRATTYAPEHEKLQRPAHNVKGLLAWQPHEMSPPQTDSSASTAPDISGIDLIEFSPRLDADRYQTTSGPDYDYDTESVHLGRPSIEHSFDAPHLPQVVRQQRSPPCDISPRIEKSEEVQIPCFIRRRGGGRQAWLPPVPKRSRGGKRGGRYATYHP